MAGTIPGGLAAAATNKARHGEDFYSRIGTAGGKSGTKETRALKGFGSHRELARIAGAKGGRTSRRGKI